MVRPCSSFAMCQRLSMRAAMCHVLQIVEGVSIPTMTRWRCGSEAGRQYCQLRWPLRTSGSLP